MALLKIILWAIVIYYLYQFVFNVVVPVGKAANNLKKGMQQMNEQLHKQQQEYNAANNTQQSTHSYNNASAKNYDNVGEYIDFEEVKNK
jgi:Sec-independent protein translocase protein TatA